MNEVGSLENLVSPLRQTLVAPSGPVRTKALKSALRGTRLPSSRMSRSLNWMTSCAMNLLGSLRMRSFSSSALSGERELPNTTPYPPASATSLMTSLEKFSMT